MTFSVVSGKTILSVPDRSQSGGPLVSGSQNKMKRNEPKKEICGEDVGVEEMLGDERGWMWGCSPCLMDMCEIVCEHVFTTQGLNQNKLPYSPETIDCP